MRPAARVLGICLALALAVFGWGYWGATRPPTVVEHTHALSGLPPGSSIRVLLISDTHLGWPDMPPDRLLSIVEQANALRPDLILLAGDYIGGKLIDFGSSPHLEPAVRPFAQLRAPLGVFAVPGNHDNARWVEFVFAAQPSPTLLVNRHVDVGPLVVAGVNSVDHGASIDRALHNLPPGKPVLLLRHEGDYLLEDRPPEGRDTLVLAGHTHGGQMMFPWLGSPADLLTGGAPLCRRGPCTINDWPLYVTSGVGTSWLPMRIGVPPEMVMITLRPA